MGMLRPIDEIADDAEIFVRSNVACMWLVGKDQAGNEIRYQPPRWLCAVVAHAELRGEERARREMREALGFVDVATVPAGCPAKNPEQPACCDETSTLVPPDATPH